MEKRINETPVPQEFQGCRIDVYLARRFTYLSRTAWKKEIVGGSVYVNGTPSTDPHKRLQSGDLVRFEGRGLQEPDVDTTMDILYEDDVLCAVNKSGNIPVHPSGRYFHNTLVSLLERQWGRKVYPVHRIDRETSGLILLAKKAEYASMIQSKFERVSKRYVAMVHGDPGPLEFEVDVPLGYSSCSAVRKRRVASYSAPEEASTRFKRICCFGSYSLLRAMPRTGRLHQIRAHLRFAGFPIVGDKIYGKDETLFLRFLEEGMTEDLEKILEFHRSALHSRSLTFSHPVDGRKMIIKAPLPRDFKDFIDKHGGRRG